MDLAHLDSNNFLHEGEGSMSAQRERSLAMKRALGLCIQGNVIGPYGYLQSQTDIGEEEAEIARKLHGRTPIIA